MTIKNVFFALAFFFTFVASFQIVAFAVSRPVTSKVFYTAPDIVGAAIGRPLLAGAAIRFKASGNPYYRARPVIMVMVVLMLQDIFGLTQ